ncbi:pyrimidine-nucleoside phosphorylase [Desulfitispora alkaliphila]|uniref:pyrimidine-nucleoside phosphorylase n=1 Tax=Desulfitispora alkaliphila TaxID=622674 RepID=UPI003D1A7258
MRAYDIILKKRQGEELSKDEIEFLISGYTKGAIPDYQLAAFSMAVFFKGMTEAETLYMTTAMMESGEIISLEDLGGVVVDKHSTGGVGDTTTIVLAPLVAAAGVPVAKMSGRGLGHTGGTIDKFEAIPGFDPELTIDQMKENVKNMGIAVVGQTANLVPADKKLYSLRDVTATVDSLPLIATSIMSKKLAAGAKALVLDVKVGSGAFLQEASQAEELAQIMVDIGKGAGRDTVAVISDMDQPLGKAVGNSLEVIEALETLQGRGPNDLTQLCLELGSQMLVLANRVSSAEEGQQFLKELIENGAAFEKLQEMVKLQKGSVEALTDYSLLPTATNKLVVKAPKGGYIKAIKANAIGNSAMLLGAGRAVKDQEIDLAVGIMLEKKVSDQVAAGEPLAVIHYNQDQNLEKVSNMILEAYTIMDSPVEKNQLIKRVIK